MKWLAPLLLLTIINLSDPEVVSENHIFTVHATNHLALSTPDSIVIGRDLDRLIVREVPAGFHVVAASNPQRRYAIEVWVEVVLGEQSPPGEWLESMRFGERLIRYRIDKSDGGNGGTQYDLLAWESCSGGYVIYRQGEILEEPFRPDFALVWKVVEGAKVP